MHAGDWRALRRLGGARRGVTWCLPWDGPQGWRSRPGGRSRRVHARPCRRRGQKEVVERVVCRPGIHLHPGELREAVRVRQLLARRLLLRSDPLRQGPPEGRPCRRVRREQLLLLGDAVQSAEGLRARVLLRGRGMLREVRLCVERLPALLRAGLAGPGAGRRHTEDGRLEGPEALVIARTGSRRRRAPEGALRRSWLLPCCGLDELEDWLGADGDVLLDDAVLVDEEGDRRREHSVQLRDLPGLLPQDGEREAKRLGLLAVVLLVAAADHDHLELLAVLLREL